MTHIRLSNIIRIDNPADYKLHCAVWNGKREPLDVFAGDPGHEDWHNWNRYKPGTNQFNRPFIFSLMRFYHEDNVWLFGGIYRVLSDVGDRYEIAVEDIGQEYVGRLKVSLKLPGRNIRPRLENHYREINVMEILRESYAGGAFREYGYENINLGFAQLETIYKNQRPDWKAALQNVKGVYLITDTSNGKKYIGAAYSDGGIWTRWACYLETGHGHNMGLKDLLANKSVEHARQCFQFTLLEFRSMRVDDQVIQDREAFWKKALLSRGDHGYNQN